MTKAATAAPKRKRWNANSRIYPCADCGKMRSKNEGGTVFTVCDDCWDKHFKLKLPQANRDGEKAENPK